MPIFAGSYVPNTYFYEQQCAMHVVCRLTVIDLKLRILVLAAGFPDAQCPHTVVAVQRALPRLAPRRALSALCAHCPTLIRQRDQS